MKEPMKAVVRDARVKIQELTPKYVWKEYGVTRKGLEAAKRRIVREIAADRKAGKLTEFTGALAPQSQRKSADSNPERSENNGRSQRNTRRN